MGGWAIEQGRQAAGGSYSKDAAMQRPGDWGGRKEGWAVNGGQRGRTARREGTPWQWGLGETEVTGVGDRTSLHRCARGWGRGMGGGCPSPWRRVEKMEEEGEGPGTNKKSGEATRATLAHGGGSQSTGFQGPGRLAPPRLATSIQRYEQ